MNCDEIAAELVEQIAEKCFQGVLPPFPDIIVQVVVETVPCIADAGQAETQMFADVLLRAAVRHLEAQRSAEQTKFLN